MARAVVFVEWSVINDSPVVLKFSFRLTSMKWSRKTSHQSSLYTLIHRWLVLATGMGDFTAWLIKAARHKASCARRLLIRTRNRQILSLLFKTKKRSNSRRIVCMNSGRLYISAKDQIWYWSFWHINAHINPITLLSVPVKATFGILNQNYIIFRFKKKVSM